MRLSTFVATSVLAMTLSSIAHADARELEHDLRIDVAVTAVGTAWWVTSELLKADLVPEKCRWCSRDENGTALVNPYDGWMRKHVLWEKRRTADVTSSILAYVVEPTAMLGLSAISAANEDAISKFPVDALLISEATIIAGNVNQLVKFGFARERPFVHFLPRAPTAVRELTDSPTDDNLSFFSGHTTLAFAVATASGTISTLRGYRLAPLVWGTGLALASTVGYLRIAADKHYFSDVLTAAIVGSAIGIGVPLVFHRPRSTDDQNVAVAAPQALTGPPIRTAFALGGAF